MCIYFVTINLVWNQIKLVSQYRINEARRLMAEGDNRIPVKLMFEQVGFKSRTAFYSAFKSITGLTPTEFYKSLQTDRW